MLKDTGERVIPDNMKPSNGMLLEHYARYYFSIPYIKGRVLDIACGSGYGVQMIAKKTKKKVSEVTGVDLDNEAIEYAKKRYYHPLLNFQRGDATNPVLPQELGTFDTILSFETIEHIEEEEQYLTNMFNLLRPGGILILSTPFGKGRGEPCGEPFHIHQLTTDEFLHLFDGYSYTKIQFYCQRGVLIEPWRKDHGYPLGIAICEK